MADADASEVACGPGTDVAGAHWKESRVTVLVRVSDDQEVRDLAEAIADLLVEHGIAAPGDEPPLSVIYAAGYEWPETPDLLVEQIDEEGAAFVILPRPGERHAGLRERIAALCAEHEHGPSHTVPIEKLLAEFDKSPDQWREASLAEGESDGWVDDHWEAISHYAEIAISTYLGALRRELPEAAVRAAQDVMNEGMSKDVFITSTQTDRAIRSFLAALTGEGTDG